MMMIYRTSLRETTKNSLMPKDALTWDTANIYPRLEHTFLSFVQIAMHCILVILYTIVTIMDSTSDFPSSP